MIRFGEKLQKLRKKKGITQEQLAQELHVTRQAVSKWESDSAQPDLENIVRICTFFEVSADELLDIDFLRPNEEKTEIINKVSNQSNTKLDKYGLLSIMFSLAILLLIYIITIIKPEMRTADDYRIMHIWEWEFISNNRLIPMFLIFLLSFAYGIIRTARMYFRE